MNTVAIIQARMGSTRLPGKIMKELMGHPMLWHAVQRVRSAKKLNRVVVATTTNKEDDVVEQFCKENEIPYYRGSAENVLSRYCEAAKKFNADVVVRITADCPLISPEIIDQCVDVYFRSGCDYVSNGAPPENRTYIRGLDVEVFSFAALCRAFEQATEAYEKEHVTPYIWENKHGTYKIHPVLPAPPEYAKDYRLTVDYPEDFTLIEKVYAALYRKPSEVIPISEAIAFLDTYPDVAQLNAHCVQKSVK